METFDESSSFNKSKWDLVQGARVGVGCASLVEGQTMTFEGHGRRQAVTVDLDLRYARSAFTATVLTSSTILTGILLLLLVVVVV